MKKLLLALGIFLISTVVPQLSAQQLNSCPSADTPLSVYDSPSFAECVIGSNQLGALDVFGFKYVSGPAGDDSNILLTAVPGPDGQGGGFTFSGFAAQGQGTQATYVIDYSYVIDPAPIGSGMSMGMDPPSGSVSVTDALCIDSTFGVSNGTTVCELPTGGISDTGPQSFMYDVADYPSIKTFNLTTDVTQADTANIQLTFVVGGPDGGSFGDLTAQNIVGDPAPEPMTSVLGLGGLLAIGIARRYRM